MKYWSFATTERPDDIDLRIDQAAAIVSNVNDLRTGQLLNAFIEADREHRFLDRGKLVIVERDPRYLEEIMAKVLPELCPRHLVTVQNHHLPHYVIRDGKVTTYHNLDKASSVEEIVVRTKHPDSIAEKVPRKAVSYGRLCERHNKHKLMVGDVNGFEVVVKEEADIEKMVNRILAIPFFRLEHLEHHRKANGYTSTHLNLIYENGNPIMRGLEVEIQITDLASHNASKYKPEQGHATAYGTEKLASKRDLRGRQLILVGNSVQIPCHIQVLETDVARIAKVPHPIHPYVLLALRE